MSTGSLCVECLTAGSGYGGGSICGSNGVLGVAQKMPITALGVYAGVVAPVARAVVAAVFMLGRNPAGVSGIAGEAGGLSAEGLERLPEK